MKQSVDSRTLDMEDIMLYPNGTWRFVYEPTKPVNVGEPVVVTIGSPVYVSILEGVSGGGIPEARSL